MLLFFETSSVMLVLFVEFVIILECSLDDDALLDFILGIALRVDSTTIRKIIKSLVALNSNVNFMMPLLSSFVELIIVFISKTMLYS